MNYWRGADGSNSLKPGSKKAAINHAADFETTTDPDDCRVWHWGFTPVDDPENMAIGTDIESFFDHVSRGNSITYFHNLRFDGRFIIPALMEDGYTYTEKRPKPGQFTALIDGGGQFYTITVKWKNGHRTEFRDSWKKLPMKLSAVAGAFGMEETKGEIDYEKVRPKGYEPTPEENDYLYRDVVILAKALATTMEEGMTRLTIGSDSMAQYKVTVGNKSYDRYFPVLAHDMDKEIRKALRGGFTYADPRFSKRIVGAGQVFDVNSLYPSVMFHELIPYGQPLYVAGRVEVTTDRPLSISARRVTARLKPGHIPCIQLKGSTHFAQSEYIEVIDEPTLIYGTNIDWELYEDHYDMTVHAYEGGWLFQAEHGLFDTFINKWSNIKANSEGGRRELAKLILNNLYGKFTTNPEVTGKVPVMGDDGIVRYVDGEPELRDPVYTAAGIFITSHARNKTIRSAQMNYDVFAYADTDSLHLMSLDKPKGIEIHPTDLGAWKFEYAFKEAMFIVPKRYLEKIDYEARKDGTRDYSHTDTFHVAFAGMPREVAGNFTFDDMVQGRMLEGKKIPKAVRGGVVLMDQKFELKW